MDHKLHPKDVLRWLDKARLTLARRGITEEGSTELGEIIKHVEQCNMEWKDGVLLADVSASFVENYARARKEIERLIGRAEQFLALAEAGAYDKPKPRRYRIRYTSEHISDGDHTLDLRPNSRRALLCEKMFSKAVKIGEPVLANDVCRLFSGSEEILPEDVRRLHRLIYLLHDAADKKGFHTPLLDFKGGTGGEVRRLC